MFAAALQLIETSPLSALLVALIAAMIFAIALTVGVWAWRAVVRARRRNRAAESQARPPNPRVTAIRERHAHHVSAIVTSLRRPGLAPPSARVLPRVSALR
jgi:heme/copper-type cytochrome/quinol oxidase subunit 2